MVTTGFFLSCRLTATSPAFSSESRPAYFDLRHTPNLRNIALVRHTSWERFRPASNHRAKPTAKADFPRIPAAADSHASGIGPFKNSPHIFVLRGGFASLPGVGDSLVVRLSPARFTLSLPRFSRNQLWLFTRQTSAEFNNSLPHDFSTIVPVAVR